MPPHRHRPPTSEKLEALASALSAGDAGQVAVAADLLARLTDSEDCARLLCLHNKGEALLKSCLALAVEAGVPADTRADVLLVLKNSLDIAEGQALICKEALLRPVLEAPPSDLSPGRVGAETGTGEVGGCACSAELASVVRQAWVSLALTAVIATRGAILEGPGDLGRLEDAVLGLCDCARDGQACSDGLVLLRHLYERRGAAALGSSEAARLAQLLRWGLGEGAAPPVPAGGEPKGAEVQKAEAQTAAQALRLLAVVGTAPAFRAALFRVEDEELDFDTSLESSPGAVGSINATIGCLFAALHGAGTMDAAAWQAMSAVAEAKSVRRLMRVHPEVRGLFSCLLAALGTAERRLTEQLVSFLKQIFTGATDQFLSTEPIMFENMGKAEGLKQLLGALLRSWRDNTDTAHRGNIVAFLADAMFFSSFTDAWQVHPQARDLIGILFDALLWKGVEGTAGLALGNFVSANGHIDLILDHERASHSISNVGWFLKRTTPGWDTKMQIYYLWRVLRSRKGCRLLARHPQADLVVAGLLTGVRHATMEDNEVVSLLECFLHDEETRPIVLRGANPGRLLDGISELLSAGESDLHEPSCSLLQGLLEATGPGVLLTWSGCAKLVGALSSKRHGKEIIDALLPMLQWEPTLTTSLSLQYKRTWISDQIRSSTPGDPIDISVNREELLRCVLEHLRDPRGLQHGVKVKFQGDETGAGDGHRRECFRLVIAALCDLEFGLFKSMDGGRTLHPSSTATQAEPDCTTYFELVGKLIALALLHRETLPAARFTLALRKMLLNAGPLTVEEDMASVDPEFFKHKVQYLLEGKYAEGESPLTLADLDLTFEDVPQPDVFPNARHELYPGGSQVAVTEENKHHYVELLCDTRMRGSVSAHVAGMIQGMRSIIPEEAWLQIQRVISPVEFDLLVSGLPEVDLADWRGNSGSDVDQDTWDLFWTVVGGFTGQQRKELLEFATGSPGPPVGGFSQLPGYGSIGTVQRFTVARNLSSMLPVASTCFNTLYLPRYTSEAEMSAGLLEAMAHRNVGGFYEGAVAR